MIFYFNFSNRLAPLLMSKMLFPLSGRKKRVNWHRQNQRFSYSSSLNANLMDLHPKMKEIEHLDHGYARFSTLLTTFTFPSYHYIMSMRHLRMKQQQIPTLTDYKNALCLKKRCTTKQLLLRSHQVSPKTTHYWYTYSLLVFRQHAIDTHIFFSYFQLSEACIVIKTPTLALLSHNYIRSFA